MAFEIRFATRKDVPTIFQFIYDLAVYEKMEDQITTSPAGLEDWIFDREKAEVLIAEEDGTPVGFALFFHNFSTWLGRAGVFLEDLYVDPAYRGKGYGKALLSRLAAIAVERECGRLEWNCLDWNTPSIGFYKSLGAIPQDEWTTYRLTGETLTALAAENE